MEGATAVAFLHMPRGHFPAAAAAVAVALYPRAVLYENDEGEGGGARN